MRFTPSRTSVAPPGRTVPRPARHPRHRAGTPRDPPRVTPVPCRWTVSSGTPHPEPAAAPPAPVRQLAKTPGGDGPARRPPCGQATPRGQQASTHGAHETATPPPGDPTTGRHHTTCTRVARECAATPPARATPRCAPTGVRQTTTPPHPTPPRGDHHGVHQQRTRPTPDGRHIDQPSRVLETLHGQPDSCRTTVSARNAAAPDATALCHAFFQFHLATDARPANLALLFLGVPFNIPSNAPLINTIAQQGTATSTTTTRSGTRSGPSRRIPHHPATGPVAA
ncbi:thymidylate synthase [Georgenia satyanarayanai]|uniref:thymidylate synthase n=1 Tax=Georgenia satyanarayanai TaxID=860221 RepID=UPI0034D799C9